MTKEGVHICETEKGSFLGEDVNGDVDGRHVLSLMEC